MPDPEEMPGPRKQDPVRRLARPAVALARAIVFQLRFASVFADVLHHPVLHQAPVAGRSPLAQVVSGYGGRTVRLVAEPTAGAARAALTGGQVHAAVIAGYSLPLAGTLLTLAATAWRRHRPASRAPQGAAQAAAAASLAS